ncbi:MAG: hypothetical protein LBB83_11795 [Treponema sp.]|nr:hypothetical protein [Treponema sp.]
MKAKYFFMGVIVLAVMPALAGCGITKDIDKPATLAEFENTLRAKGGGSRPGNPVDIAHIGSGRARLRSRQFF